MPGPNRDSGSGPHLTLALQGVSPLNFRGPEFLVVLHWSVMMTICWEQPAKNIFESI